MLRSLTFIAVRQEYRQTAKTPPLRLAGGNELVEQHLRAVREVAELCFPDHQRIRIGRRIAVFKTEHARSEEHTSELQSLMRISYAVICLNTLTNTERTVTD